ncbi:hypothetical protein GCM10010365_10300 [Streptomyces poonensis]|uniref:VCBS repeat-containing protein n=1 Tax=Streptomyces poonensis TaxID=68255 RepID=A0A918PAZ0_9ACTN|nr:hypothetical protein GCM10010365_10300 [Streptomyces poonensis]GLJ87530.1 hypothetical protein GCM10017589_01300 [Streptomyces poonensis]
MASREIRKVDFANLEWFDSTFGSTVKLVDGSAWHAAGNDTGGWQWNLLGRPQFADVDGDGHEDAVAGLASSGDMAMGQAWYVWLWRDGRAQQLRVPVVASTRCDRRIESVTAVPHGFEVQAFLFVDGDSCAGGGSVPITYVVGVRDGWPVRLRPQYGPLDTCDPGKLTVALHPQGKPVLYTSPDVRSPTVEPAAHYDALLVDEYAADPALSPELDWVLGIAVSGDRRVCGWARADQVRGAWH